MALPLRGAGRLARRATRILQAPLEAHNARHVVACKRRQAAWPQHEGFRTSSIPLTAVNIPSIENEPMPTFAPGTIERQRLREALDRMKEEVVEVPVVIGGKEHFTGDVVEQHVCSDHQNVIARCHQATGQLVNEATEVARAAREQWDATPWEDRAAVYLKAAELISKKYRYDILASTMLGQGKNVWQAEIDTAEAIDFLRFNVKFANQIYGEQPERHSPGVWNRVNYRSLEGFVAAVSPFNFTAIGVNLATAPTVMGNAVLWKPASTSVLSNYLVFKVLQEAGLPDGVINFLPCSGPTFGDSITSSDYLTCINFTGSTDTFNFLWRQVGERLSTYIHYPRLIGECGGKNFHFVHPTAEVANVINETLRSSFEYQGQKCSACSRIYVPKSLWPEIRDGLLEGIGEIKMGQSDDFGVFMSAVIDQASFDNISGFIERASERPHVKLLAGGGTDNSVGYFVEPTLFESTDPKDELMSREIFGPVLTAYVYDDEKVDDVYQTIRTTSEYGLTGSVFAQDRAALRQAQSELKDAAGNFYLNVKSTGAVVGQQPFGGARSSGTNDKAGAPSYLLRFTSLQSVKESFLASDDWRYPHMEPEK